LEKTSQVICCLPARRLRSFGGRGPCWRPLRVLCPRGTRRRPRRLRRSRGPRLHRRTSRPGPLRLRLRRQRSSHWRQQEPARGAPWGRRPGKLLTHRLRWHQAHRQLRRRPPQRLQRCSPQRAPRCCCQGGGPRGQDRGSVSRIRRPRSARQLLLIRPNVIFVFFVN
jgi:hypothetical protein